MSKIKMLEWLGAITAIAYSLLVAANIGVEFFAFTLLFLSAVSLGFWAYLGKHKAILLLQLFYVIAAVIGMVRWF